MTTAWRIVKAKHQATAFDGEGARIGGGRWNSPGTAVVYVSESAALATLEQLVHLNDSTLLPSFVLIPCDFDERLVVRMEDIATLPANWSSYPAPPALQAIGDKWVKDGRSAVLSVPSAVIAIERNFALNPGHPAFAAVTIGAARRFDLDLRLIRPSKGHVK